MARVLQFRDGELRLDRAAIMGILNVTPDSFSDGGRFLDPTSAVEHALQMFDEGAGIVDIGGESTRPGADPVSAEEEWRRVHPVMAALRGKTDGRISIDTYRPEVASKALSWGADMVNDVRGLRDPRMAALVARERVPAVVMHMAGEPKTMNAAPVYDDVVREVGAFLKDRTQAALAAGIGHEAIVVDPGFGFGKRPEHNTELLRHLDEIRALGFPVLAGTSGKRFLAESFGGPGKGRDANLAAAVIAVERGADILRVHDVAATAKAIRATDAVSHATR